MPFLFKKKKEKKTKKKKKEEKKKRSERLKRGRNERAKEQGCFWMTETRNAFFEWRLLPSADSNNLDPGGQPSLVGFSFVSEKVSLYQKLMHMAVSHFRVSYYLALRHSFHGLES